MQPDIDAVKKAFATAKTMYMCTLGVVDIGFTQDAVRIYVTDVDVIKKIHPFIEDVPVQVVVVEDAD